MARALRRPSLHGRSLALAAFLGVFAASAAAQDPLARADRAYDAGRLAEAGVAYESALEGGALDPPELVRVHLRLGVLTAMGGQPSQAERHFALALALDPTLDPPPELDEALAERFVALRETRDGHRLSVRLRASDEGVLLEVRDAAPGAVRQVLARGAGGYEQRFAWEGERLPIDPPAAALPLEVVALDAHGNRLARAGARRGGLPTPRAVSPLDRDGESPAHEGTTPSWFETPWLWIVVGLAVLGVGVAVGVSASGERYVLDGPVVR